MSAKHTPGPWAVKCGAGIWGEFGLVPDLLADLREALEFVDDMQDGAPDAHPTHRRAAELYCRFSDTIYRATGERP